MREHDARSVGVDFSRSGVTPHRQQAPSRIWSPLPLPSLRRRRPTGVYRRPALPAPVQQSPSATPTGGYREPAGREGA